MLAVAYKIANKT